MKSNVMKMQPTTTTTYASSDMEFGDGEVSALTKLEIYLGDEYVEEVIAQIRSRVSTAIIFESETYRS